MMEPCNPACPWAFFGPMLGILAYFIIGGLLYTVTKSTKVVYVFHPGLVLRGYRPGGLSAD